MRISLYVLEIELASHDLILMDLLAMRTRSLLPPSHGSFIEIQRMDNRLNGASIGKERHDDHNECFWFA